MVAQATNPVHVDFDVPVPMRDGVVLRANVFRPDDGGAGTYPVLVTRTPYGKDLPLGESGFSAAQFAKRGYITVVQDARGCFASAGDWMPFTAEGYDGADTIAWAARLPGANGTVGTYGLSYMGFTQWAAAREGPEALRAMAPAITWDKPGDGVVARGGALEFGTAVSWTMQSNLGTLLKRYRADPAARAEAMRHLAQEFDGLAHGGYEELPLDGFGPLERSGLGGYIAPALRPHDDSDYWSAADITPAYARTHVPALHIGGWYDIFLNGTLRNFASMCATDSPGQYLVIGPWTHGVFSGVAGDVSFGLAGSGALLDLRTDLADMHVQFFDRWLKGRSNAADHRPAVRYFVMGANTWRSSDTWPPTASQQVRWYLHSQGHANTAEGDGRLSGTQPADESADQYVYDPARPVPTIGGATLMHPLWRAGPLDQRPLELRPDVLVYTSARLARPLEVTGPVSVVLYVATDAPDTDFVARLVDVYPDGRAIPLTDGVLRMRARDGSGLVAEPLDSARAYQIEIDLWATSAVFAPGHRVRLDVTSSSFPRWDRNLNTGEALGHGAQMRPALQAILHDAAHPSHVLLPLLLA